MERRIVWLLALCAMAFPALAEDADTALKEIASALAEENVAKARALLESAEARAAKLEDDAKLGQIIEAYGHCIKKTQKHNPLVAVAAVESVGDLAVPGSSKVIRPLLRVPSRVPEAQRYLHVTAIAATGEIHDPNTLPDLERLVKHKDTGIAVAATKSLVGYKGMKREDRLKLLGRLSKTLASFEKHAVRARKDEQRDHYNELLSHLRSTMTKLAASSTATTAKEWQAWIKEELKKERTRRLQDG